MTDIAGSAQAVSYPKLPPIRTCLKPRKAKLRGPFPRPGSLRLRPGNTKPTMRDSRRPTTDNRCPTTDNRQPMSDNRQPMSDNRCPTTDNRQPTTDNRQPTTDNRQPTTDNRQPTTVVGQPMSDNRQPTTVVRCPTSYRAFAAAPRRTVVVISNAMTPPIRWALAIIVGVCGRAGRLVNAAPSAT